MSKNELIERDGVYFQEATTMSFTDSHWTIVTNLSLEEINEQLRNVEKWLKERMQKTPINNLAAALNARARTLATEYLARLEVGKKHHGSPKIDGNASPISYAHEKIL